MKDYRLELKVKNNRILEAIEAEGFTSIRRLCMATGMSESVVGQFVNLKRSPIDKRFGAWSVSALRLSDALRMLPEDLWTDVQQQTCLMNNVATAGISESAAMQIFINQSTPQELLEDKELRRAVLDIVDTLPPREKDVLSMRYSLPPYDAQHTLREVADKINVGPERVRQIECKAFRRLRHPTRRDRLRKHL